MERFIESEKNLPFTQKSVAELVLEMNKALEDVPEMTEELIEDDAEGGYFDDLEYYAEDD